VQLGTAKLEIAFISMFSFGVFKKKFLGEEANFATNQTLQLPVTRNRNTLGHFHVGNS
jgi:hypothetical protein